MKSIYTHQTENIWKTWIFMGSFLILVIGVGYFFAGVMHDSAILYGAVIFSVVMSIGSYWWSDKMVLHMHNARAISKEDAPELYTIVENLAITAGLPMPTLYIIDDPALNAFATGRDPEHAAMAFTSGIIAHLDKAELQGVAAHEMSHIGNRDMLVMTVAVVLAGFISLLADWFRNTLFFGGDDDRPHPLMLVAAIIVSLVAPLAALLIRMAISRRREFLADATGALLTRYPDGLARALEKISSDSQQLATAQGTTAHLFISNPFKGGAIMRLFMTHPPIEERIARLREMAR